MTYFFTFCYIVLDGPVLIKQLKKKRTQKLPMLKRAFPERPRIVQKIIHALMFNSFFFCCCCFLIACVGVRSSFFFFVCKYDPLKKKKNKFFYKKMSKIRKKKKK